MNHDDWVRVAFWAVLLMMVLAVSCRVKLWRVEECERMHPDASAAYCWGWGAPR